jgi:type IV pilus assembly protein PilO
VRVNLKDAKTRNLVLTVLMVGAGLYFFLATDYLPFGYRPTAKRIQALRSDYEKKSSDLARARQAVADLPRFQAEYTALHERYEMAAELLPAERELPGLLRKITLAGQQAGVVFQLVRPEPPVARTHYTELPIYITVRGGYHQVGQFLAQLANLERIVNVGTVNLASFGAADEDATCEASFAVSAYMMNPAEAAPAQTGAQERKKS